MNIHQFILHITTLLSLLASMCSAMETNTELRKNLEPDKMGKIAIDLPPSIKTVEIEEPFERRGKCTYVAMSDLLGIAHEKAPFKMLEPRDWTGNIHFKQYFNQTNTPHVGDLVVYYPDDQINGEPLHFGIVTRFSSITNAPIVRSKWGIKSEIFEHELYAAPLSYGTAAKFFTLKSEYQQKEQKTALLTELQNVINNSQGVKDDLPLLQILFSEFANGNNIIISKGADLNEYESIQEKIHYLLKSYPGLDINGYGRSIYTPLMSAAMRGDYKTTELLINFGADINKQNKDGNTALILAVKRGRDNVIPLLLDAGADPEIANNYGYKAATDLKQQK